MSKRWNSLMQAVETLRKQFLPDAFDPLGNYPQPSRIQAHTRAFVIFSHAEIESYLEGWAKDIARSSEQIWQASARITKPLAFLLATAPERVTVTFQLATAKDTTQKLTEATVTLFHKYYKNIKDNHGIKEANVLGLFGPLGIPGSALGATLIPNLDSCGTD